MRFIEFYNSFVTTLSLRDLSTFIKRSQQSYQELAALLSRNRSTPVKRLQHSYQQITVLLSRDYSTLIKRLQHSYQQITALLSRDYSALIKRLQHSYQEIAALLSRDCSTLIKRLQHSCQEITTLFSTDYSTLVKLDLRKAYTEDQIKKLNNEEVDKLFNNYEAKLSSQIVKSLGHSIINMYSMGACAVLGISNQDASSKDLVNDPFLNSALQRFTCELYYRFSSFLAPLSVGLITSRHYFSECNKNGGTNGTSGTEDINLE